MGQDLGREVKVARPRKQNAEAQLDALVKSLAETGRMDATLRVPDAVGPLIVEADLRTRQVTTTVEVEAPREGPRLPRSTGFCGSWSEAPGDLRLDMRFANTKETTSVLLSEAREYPQRLLSPTDPKREPRSFRLALSRPMGRKRGKGEGSFVRETRQQTVDFYRDLVQDLRAWQPTAPKLPKKPQEAPATPQPSPPPFSATDERDLGEAVSPTGDNDGPSDAAG